MEYFATVPNPIPAPGSAADILCLVLTRHQMWPHQARVPREDPGYSQASQEWTEHYDIKTAQPAHNILNTQSWSTPTFISCVTTTNNNIQASLIKWRLVVSCELKQCWANDVKPEQIPGVSVWALCHEWTGRAQVIRSRQHTGIKVTRPPGISGWCQQPQDDGPCQQIKRDSPHIWGWKTLSLISALYSSEKCG